MTIMNMTGSGSKPDVYDNTLNANVLSDSYTVNSNYRGNFTGSKYTCSFTTSLYVINVVDVISKIICVFNVSKYSSNTTTSYETTDSSSTILSGVLANIQKMDMKNVGNVLSQSGFKNGQLFNVRFGIYLANASDSSNVFQDSIYNAVFKLNGNLMEFVSASRPNGSSFTPPGNTGDNVKAVAYMTDIQPVN